MRTPDLVGFNWRVLSRHRLRTFLQLIAVAIGVSAVILLTSLGEGAKNFVVNEFKSLGNRLLTVVPGKKETTGGAPPMFGTTPRDLTLDDAISFYRLAGVTRIAPIIAGSVAISHGSRSREALTIGTTAEFFPIRQIALQQGQGLPADTLDRARPVCVIGSKLRRELFGSQPALGRWIRAGEYRFRVIGVIAEGGESIGIDLGDMLVVPVRSAEMLFNSHSLFRVLVELRDAEMADSITEGIRELIRQRHDGEDDVTVISQDAVVSSFNSLISNLTAVVTGIASISLIVAGLLIMNVSLISVSQRKAEIGLLKALGASQREVLWVFLSEAVLLALLGVLLGALIALLLILAADQLMPLLPLAMPWWALFLAGISAVTLALLFAWFPARQAARLDPVTALQGER